MLTVGTPMWGSIKPFFPYLRHILTALTKLPRTRRTVYRGIRKVDQQFKLTMTASNLVRMVRILSGSQQGAVA